MPPKSSRLDPLAWERWWAGIEGRPGEIVWDADVGDLEADLDHFVGSFGQALPVIGFGCGDGRQTRFLARHFPDVLGVDVSAAATGRARTADNPRTSASGFWTPAIPPTRSSCTAGSVTPTFTSAACCRPCRFLEAPPDTGPAAFREVGDARPTAAGTSAQRAGRRVRPRRRRAGDRPAAADRRERHRHRCQPGHDRRARRAT